MDAEFKIDFGNGFVTVQPPLNKDAIQIDIIFTKDKARAALQSINFEWVGDTAAKINAYKDAGIQGGKGIAFALPLKIDICPATSALPAGAGNLAFNLMLNLAHEAARFECDKVVCPIKEAGGTDWFEKQTQAYSFWYLTTIGAVAGQITQSDYKKTPYAISSIPNYTQIVTISITIFIVTWQAIEIIMTFTEKGTEIVGDITETAVPVVGTPHAPPTFAHILSIVLRIVNLGLIIFYIVKLIDDLQDNIIQKRKYKLCMREEDLFLKMCAFLGINFSSTIYGRNAPLGYNGQYKHATWMPQKIVMPKVGQNILKDHLAAAFDRPEDELTNLKSYGYFDGTFAEFITVMETKYNAEARVINGTLYFEEKHSPLNLNPYQIPNTADVGYTFNLPNPHGTNLHELTPYTRLAFQLDETELNTIHRYRGTSLSVTISSPFPLNKYSGWGQGQLIDLGSALAKRKDYLNDVETFIDGLVQAVYTFFKVVIAPINLVIDGINAVLNAINNVLTAINTLFGTNLPTVSLINHIKNPINPNALLKRIGWMELSNDSFSKPKTFIGTQVGSDWELHQQTETLMSAQSLFNDFHGLNLATRGNQYLTFFNKKSAFCCSDFFKIMNSNVLRTPDNKNGKFTKMLWDLHSEIATDTEYRINQVYINGLKEKILIDGTQ